MSAEIISIYRCQRKPGAYLYVPKKKALTDLPPPLLDMLGKLQHAFSFLLTPDRPLERADASQVLDQLRQQGYYLQMPPATDPDAWDPRQGVDES